jgi:hypothetical protein
MFFVQSWGNHVDVAQAVLYYFTMLGCLALFCWIGNELTEEVRIITIYLHMKNACKRYLRNTFDNYNSVQILTG